MNSSETTIWTSLLNEGFNVWEQAWTKQEAYLKNKSAWKHLKGVQK